MIFPSGPISEMHSIVFLIYYLIFFIVFYLFALFSNSKLTIYKLIFIAIFGLIIAMPTGLAHLFFNKGAYITNNDIIFENKMLTIKNAKERIIYSLGPNVTIIELENGILLGEVKNSDIPEKFTMNEGCGAISFGGGDRPITTNGQNTDSKNECFKNLAKLIKTHYPDGLGDISIIISDTINNCILNLSGGPNKNCKRKINYIIKNGNNVGSFDTEQDTSDPLLPPLSDIIETGDDVALKYMNLMHLLDKDRDGWINIDEFCYWYYLTTILTEDDLDAEPLISVFPTLANIRTYKPDLEKDMRDERERLLSADKTADGFKIINEEILVSIDYFRNYLEDGQKSWEYIDIIITHIYNNYDKYLELFNHDNEYLILGITIPSRLRDRLKIGSTERELYKNAITLAKVRHNVDGAAQYTILEDAILGELDIDNEEEYSCTVLLSAGLAGLEDYSESEADRLAIFKSIAAKLQPFVNNEGVVNKKIIMVDTNSEYYIILSSNNTNGSKCLNIINYIAANGKKPNSGGGEDEEDMVLINHGEILGVGLWEPFPNKLPVEEVNRIERDIITIRTKLHPDSVFIKVEPNYMIAEVSNETITQHFTNGHNPYNYTGNSDLDCTGSQMHGDYSTVTDITAQIKLMGNKLSNVYINGIENKSVMILLSNGIGLILNGSSTHKCINKLKYIRETGRLNPTDAEKAEWTSYNPSDKDIYDAMIDLENVNSGKNFLRPDCSGTSKVDIIIAQKQDQLNALETRVRNMWTSEETQLTEEEIQTKITNALKLNDLAYEALIEITQSQCDDIYEDMLLIPGYSTFIESDCGNYSQIIIDINNQKDDDVESVIHQLEEESYSDNWQKNQAQARAAKLRRYAYDTLISSITKNCKYNDDVPKVCCHANTDECNECKGMRTVDTSTSQAESESSTAGAEAAASTDSVNCQAGETVDQCQVCDGDNTTCKIGCVHAGYTWNSSSSSCCQGTVDECQVCNGDNTSCAGCDNMPNSGKVLDDCGACDGDNTSCETGCDLKQGYTWNSSSSSCCEGTVDDCGVCNGNNTSCETGCDLKQGYTWNSSFCHSNANQEGDNGGGGNSAGAGADAGGGAGAGADAGPDLGATVEEAMALANETDQKVERGDDLSVILANMESNHGPNSEQEEIEALLAAQAES